MKSELSTKMILVEDLIDIVKGRLLDRLVKNQALIYKKNPNHSPSCNDGSIVGVEIMGALEGVLLWECESCFDMFLKYEADKTEIELQQAKGYWTNASDWGYVPRSKFN